MRDEYEITDSIQIFIDDGYRVEAAEIIESDLNLSYPADLLEINLYALRASGENNYRGANVEVHAGATLDRCVLMAGARIETPVELRECLVFADVAVGGDQPRSKTIFTADREIPCDE